MAQTNYNRFRDTDKRTLVFGLLIIGALIFFEIFNYSTTHFALQDLLGEQRTFGIRWATALSLAFCAIDFAGISRIFTPERGSDEPREIWYLFGAWMLAATMNASLTWWGVSMAITNHTIQSTAIVEASKIISVVPIFVSILVWVIRVLVIGSISTVGDRLLWGSTSSRPSLNTRSTVRSGSFAKPTYSRTPTASTRRAAPARSASNAYFDSIGDADPISDPVRIQSATAYPQPSAARPRESVPSRHSRYTSSEPTYHSLNGLGHEADPQPAQPARRM